MKSKRRKLDVAQLLRRAVRQPEIFRDGKTNLRPAFHADNDEAGQMFCGSCGNFFHIGSRFTSL